MRLFALVLATLLAPPLSAQTPQEVAALYAREIAPLPPLPPIALAAFVAAEDRAFFDRATGLSPITAQVTQILNFPGWGLMRLPYQALVANALSHDEILSLYVNRVFFGLGCFGLRDAARAYYGKTLDDLTLAESAFLAALPRSPAHFNPERVPDKARARRDFVLGEMAKSGAISSEDAAAARAAPLTHQTPLDRCR